MQDRHQKVEELRWRAVGTGLANIWKTFYEKDLLIFLKTVIVGQIKLLILGQTVEFMQQILWLL